MTFLAFAENLSQTLAELEAGRRPYTQEPLFRWMRAGGQGESWKTGAVSIGVGRLNEGAEPSGIDYLILNNKNASFWGKSSWSSVTRMIQDFGGDQWAKVRSILGLGRETPPVAFFGDRTIIVEDASPDSVLSLYALLLGVADVQDNPLDSSFCEAIDLWERGHTAFPGKYVESWPLLQAALSHQYFEHAPRAGDEETGEDLGGLNEAWLRSLHLLNHVLVEGYPVHEISGSDFFQELHMARCAAELEHQFYVNAKQRSETLQLLLPVHGVKGREKLVDAFFLEEELSTGIAKVYLRNDREGSHLGKGYGLLVMNREEETGTGNELSVSADPRERLDLAGLWIDLERKEWEKRPERLRDEPRDLRWLDAIYEREHIEKASQSWYLNEQFDLIAAPRPDRALIEASADKNRKTSGTCLSWSDLKDAVWERYNPARNILVAELDIDAAESAGGNAFAEDRGAALVSVPLIETGPRRSGASEKTAGLNLRLFHYDPDNRGLSFLVTETMERIFAALIVKRDRRIGIDDLPETDSFDVITIRGGFVIAHEDGALAFNDWGRTQLDIRSVSVEFRKAKARYELIRGRAEDAASRTVTEESIEADIRKLMKPERVWKNISDHFADMGLQKGIGFLRTMILDPEYRRRYGSNEKLLSWLNLIKLELDKVWTETEAEPAFRELRSAIEKRWGLEHVVEELYESVERLEGTLRTASELRTEGLVFVLSFYGFPLVFFASFFSGILKGWIESPESRFSFMAFFDTVHVAGLASYLGLSGLVIALLGFINRKK